MKKNVVKINQSGSVKIYNILEILLNNQNLASKANLKEQT